MIDVNQGEAEKLWSLMQEVGVAMLVSRDDDVLRARPMHTVQDEFNGTLYFFTKKNAHKVDEVQGMGDVCVTYSHPNKRDYVSLSGTAALLQDRALIERLWNDEVAVWFEGGKDDPEVALIAITVNQAEYWDSPASDIVRTLKIKHAQITDDTPDLGEHAKVN